VTRCRPSMRVEQLRKLAHSWHTGRVVHRFCLLFRSLVYTYLPVAQYPLTVPHKAGGGVKGWYLTGVCW
jgi:hypothetical protein